MHVTIVSLVNVAVTSHTKVPITSPVPQLPREGQVCDIAQYPDSDLCPYPPPTNQMN